MIIIDVKNGGIEKALKEYKFKRKEMKLNQIIRDRQEFTKKSEKRRQQILKAVYIEKLKSEE